SRDDEVESEIVVDSARGRCMGGRLWDGRDGGSVADARAVLAARGRGRRARSSRRGAGAAAAGAVGRRRTAERLPGAATLRRIRARGRAGGPGGVERDGSTADRAGGLR